MKVKLSRKPGSGELRVTNLHDLFARFNLFPINLIECAAIAEVLGLGVLPASAPLYHCECIDLWKDIQELRKEKVQLIRHLEGLLMDFVGMQNEKPFFVKLLIPLTTG